MTWNMGDIILYIATEDDAQQRSVAADLIANVARVNADGTADLLVIDSAGDPFGAKGCTVAKDAPSATPGQCKPVLLARTNPSRQNSP